MGRIFYYYIYFISHIDRVPAKQQTGLPWKYTTDANGFEEKCTLGFKFIWTRKEDEILRERSFHSWKTSSQVIALISGQSWRNARTLSSRQHARRSASVNKKNS